MPRLTEIVPEDLYRTSTGLEVMDWMWGYSKIDGVYEWGLPEKKITLLAGEGGVGKTRLGIEIAKSLLVHTSWNVLYIQGEVGLPTAANWMKDIPREMAERLFLEDSSTIDDQLKVIIDYRPVLAVIDSVQMIREYKSGHNDEAIQLIIERFKKVIEKTGTHIIFISHMTKGNKIKGSSMLSHMIDIIWYARKDKTCAKNEFFLITDKNRCGQSGLKSYWQHAETGIVGRGSSQMGEDELWCQTHHVSRMKEEDIEEKDEHVLDIMTEEERRGYIDKVRNFDDPLQGNWLTRKAMKIHQQLFCKKV